MFRMFVRTMCDAPQSKPTPISVFGIDGRYATALYRAGHRMNQLDAIEKHLRTLKDLLIKPKIIDFIETSLISRAGKAKLLTDVGTETGMPPAAVNLLALVAENGRLKLLRRIIIKFLDVMVAHRNEALCEVITAKQLDSKTRDSLLQTLERFVQKGKKIQLTEKIDPSIIGGMIVGIEDKHIDMSIANKVQLYTAILKRSV